MYRWKSAAERARYVQRLEETMQNAGIDVVGNHHGNLFILHEKREVVETSPESTETTKITRKRVETSPESKETKKATKKEMRMPVISFDDMPITFNDADVNGSEISVWEAVRFYRFILFY